MRKILLVVVVFSILLLPLATIVFAQEEAAKEAISAGQYSYYSLAALACGIGIGLAALGTGIGQGIGLSKAAEGVARNPSASGKVTTTLIIGLAMIESLCIYALVVVLIILFVKPFGF